MKIESIVEDRYPQHQQRAWQQLEKGTHHIDFIIEVRDARIPLTCTETFQHMARDKLIVYNKADLANPNSFRWLKDQEKCLFTNAGSGLGVKKIIEMAIKKCSSDPIRFPYLSMIVVGAPNVGKSTLINQLRRLGNKNPTTKVGKLAGVTTSIQTRVKIHDDPPIYLFDTPGIFNPLITNPLDGLKIALTGGTNDKLVSIVSVADYLLFRLNLVPSKRKIYPRVLGIPWPTDNIYELAAKVCVQKNWMLGKRSRFVKLGGPDVDVDMACQYFVDLFRAGAFGVMTLDDIPPKTDTSINLAY